MCCVCVFPCSRAHIWNTKLRVGLSCWFIFIFSYDDWGQLVLTTSTFVFLLEVKAERMKKNLDLIWSCFFLPWRSTCILTTAQLESASCEELTAVVSRVTHPEDDSCTLVVGKCSSMLLCVLLKVLGLQLLVWLEECFHSCSTRNMEASLWLYPVIIELLYFSATANQTPLSVFIAPEVKLG